ncbi:hypothetical protein B9Z19DRAFT_789644 [Tuber borchii]|uniref:Uncharacterized protein n=1 Tax=Tuber borchii TaxID=42251 RepID=A0A2T6ZWK2_TUBBO|nr:hypothetical protein B9Z19DRAFT_789644 [Tuber borchii]
MRRASYQWELSCIYWRLSVQYNSLSFSFNPQYSSTVLVLSASISYPPFFSITWLSWGGTDKEHLRVGHSLKREFTSCLTGCRLISPITSDLFPNVLTSPLSFLSSFSLLTFHPSTLRVFFFICLVDLPYITRPGALFFFRHPLFFYFIYGRID